MRYSDAARKTIGCVVLVIGCAACSESDVALTPTSPTVLSTSAVADVSTVDMGAGISCPSDAPVVRVGGVATRVDVEWAPIDKVSVYEVDIERYGVSNAWVAAHNVQVSSTRLEWYGQTDSRYRVRVRSHRCGATGQWSSWVPYSVNGGSTSSPAPAPPAAAGPLTNGSFESAFSGWTTGGNLSIEPDNAAYDVTHGAFAVAFNAGNAAPNGTLSQAFTTTPGTTYTLAFDVGAMSFSNTNTQSLQVRVQGSSQLLLQTVTVAAPGNGTSYSGQSFNFVANSASTTLTFTDVSASTANVDLMLDNVRITP